MKLAALIRCKSLRLSTYLKEIDRLIKEPTQTEWLKRLEAQVQQGEEILAGCSLLEQTTLSTFFNDKIRTEEIKAWYGEPENGSLFQGTSISSLTIPHVTEKPIHLETVHDLEDEIANSYICYHDLHENKVRGAHLESVEHWLSEGLYYGVVIGSKVISQAFQLATSQEEIIFSVEGVKVDPHEIAHYPNTIREAYFLEARKRIECLQGIDLTQSEFEECLLLADISKPKLQNYKNKLILGPPRCNELCALISRNITTKIREISNGRISPRSLMVTIYDSDTPYGYHQVAGYLGRPHCPILPGLTVLGSSGTIDAFRWLYAYRTSLVSQKIMKGSIYSQVQGQFIPFVFYGVLVERDAEILLDLARLSFLRYRRNLSPYLEYLFLVPSLKEQLDSTSHRDFKNEARNRVE